MELKTMSLRECAMADAIAKGDVAVADLKEKWAWRQVRAAVRSYYGPARTKKSRRAHVRETS